MTYEENLRKTSDLFTESHNQLSLGGYGIEDSIKLFAEYCLKEKAEAYSAGYSVGRDMDNDPFSRAGLSTMLKQLGLIP